MNLPRDEGAGRNAPPGAGRTAAVRLRLVFVLLGVLPFLLLLAVLVFAFMSDNFLTGRNLLNVVRQSTYLALVSMGQMFALLTGGFDLSVGTILALTSVVGATAMAGAYAAMPDAVGLSILIGILAGVAAGTAVGVVNGVGIALFNVSPFDEPGHGIGRLRPRPLHDRRHTGLRNARGVRRHLRLRIDTRCAGPGSRHRDPDRDPVLRGQLDPARPVFLRRRRKRRGRAPVRHRYAADAVPGLCPVRCDGGGCRHPADRAPGHGRGQHRCDHAARVDCGLRDRGRQPARRHRPDRERGPRRIVLRRPGLR